MWAIERRMKSSRERERKKERKIIEIMVNWTNHVAAINFGWFVNGIERSLTYGVRFQQLLHILDKERGNFSLFFEFNRKKNFQH